MKKTFFGRALSIAASAVMLVVALAAFPVSAEEENVSFEEFFASAGGVKQISLGWTNSAAVTTNGDLYTWGNNYKGTLGNGTTDESHVPVKIMSNVASVSLGMWHSAAVTTNGDLYTWGDNDDGQLGNGTTADSKIPVKIMSNVASVSLGRLHSAAVKTNGDLYTWGNNGNGQLGNGTNGYDTNSNVPVKIMSNVASVSLGRAHSAAITTNGDLYTWGENDSRQLGDGTITDSNVPVKIMSNVASVSFRDSYSAAVTTNGNLYTWGNNYKGALGNGTTDYSSNPVKVMNNVASVSLGVGGSHSAAVTTNGDLYTWGYNYDGQLGDRTTTDSRVPVKIMSNVASVSLGGWHSAAVTTNGDLYTWGSNGYGQLGNGTTTSGSVPTKVSFFSGTQATEKPKITKVIPGDGQVGLNWSAVNGATQYAVYYKNGSKWVNAGKTTALGKYVRGLSNGTKYGFAVKAYVNGAWTGITSADIVYATPSAPVTKPKITKIISGNGQIGLNWSAVNGATQYAVYYRYNNKWYNAGTTTALGKYVRGLNNGTKYGFAVKAYVNGAWTGITSADIVYATPSAPVTKPKITKIIPGNGQVGLNWTAVSGATQYAVYYRSSSKWVNAGTTTALGKYVRGLNNGTKYAFIVKAYVNGSWIASSTVYATPAAAKSELIIDELPDNIEFFGAAPVLA